MKRAGIGLFVVLLLGMALLQSMGSVVAVSDTTPPVVQSASLSANAVAAGGSLTVSLHITDDLSGLAARPDATIQFNLSGGTQSIFVYDFIRVSGTPQDGVYQAIVNVPAAYPSGTYAVTNLAATDQASNSVRYTSCCVPQIPAADNISFTVGNAAPTLSGLNPASIGAGGDPFDLTVLGSNFQNGAKVSWNGSPRTTIFVSPTQLTARITAADIAITGTVSIIATNPDNQTSSVITFTITTPLPKPLSLDTTSGPSAGGTAVTITGKYFQQGATVTFGGVAATSVTVVSTTQINVVTPMVSIGGPVDVVVKNPDGLSGTLREAFTFSLRPGPVIPGANPAPEPQTRGGSAVPGSKPDVVPTHR